MFNILSQKRCTKCGEWKSKSEFHRRKDKGKKESLRSWCKVCVGKWHSAFQKEHPEKTRAISLRWSRENHEKHLFSNRRWRAENPGKDAERKRRQYQENHAKELELARIRNNKRRARIIGNGGTITKNEWRELKEFYNHTCLCCRKREPEIKLTIDHVVPLTLGGMNVAGNIQPLCQPCNSSKGKRYIDYRQKEFH